MLLAERQLRIKDLLAQRGIADVDSLSAELNVSQSTIRRDVEMLDPVFDVRNDDADLGGAIRLHVVLNVDPHWLVVLANAIDTPRNAHLGAEGCQEETLEDLGVGEGPALGRAALGDLWVFGRLCKRPVQRDEEQPTRDAAQIQFAEESREERA